MKTFPSGAAVEIFETLDSTSAEAKRRAAAGERGPLWIVAQRQTAGYGRRGRAWEQGRGDFAGTLLFAPDASLDVFGQLSFVAALAVYDAIDAFIGKGDLQIKWPNDILLGAAKVAGLLLETAPAADGARLLVGVGVNMISKPDGIRYKTARLFDFGMDAPATPVDFAAALDRNFWAHHSVWRKYGFAPIRTAWLARAAGLGSTIAVRLPNETVSGVFEDLDKSGGLVLRFDGGTRIINAGDVYFGAAGEN